MRVFSLLLVVVGLFAESVIAGDPAAPDYNRDVRPILAKNCYACHGPDESKREAGLRLDRVEDATKALESGSVAIVPGDPENSELVFRVSEEDETMRMPPKTAGVPLTEAQVETLRRWVAAGASFAEHWSFVRPEAKTLPEVSEPGWVRNAIDRWVLARLDREGLRPAPEADRFILLRRASLDLRGLPPSPREIDAFAADAAPDAYERAIERFLADPAFGERWARVWLDLARYADSAGYGSDPLRPNMYRYRDWVIQALNRNLPYDRFTIEQLAGDLLPGATEDQRIATAFHRNTMTNTEGGTDDEEWRTAAIKDRADTTMQVWMGLTFGCAKCHTHKYDPISNTEYYSLYAFFNQTADNDQPDESPTLPSPTAAMREQLRKIDPELSALRLRLNALLAPEAIFASPFVSDPSPLPPLYQRIAALEKARPQVPALPVMVELPAEKRRRTRLLNKGNFLDPGAPVEPTVPAAFHPFPSDATRDRLGLARWLVEPANPLSARVAVNRLWAAIFGIGLVETEEDFGTQGEPPSHPELLDWLALEYQRDGWDTKAILRTIVTSATYRQSSRVTPELLAKDPRNRLLARSPRYRLEAETVRDQALALSGLLSRKLGGPSVFPPQPEGLWQAAFNGQRTWATSTGADSHRRGLYTFWRRTVPYPSMATFDAPSREICALRRVRTNTPLQAFVTLNDPVYVEAAQALGRRIAAEGGTSVEERVEYGLKLALGRPAGPEQVAPLAELYQSEVERYRSHPDDARALATEPIGPLPDGADPAEMAAWTTVANVLLNLDGVLTRN
jgi:hypothetical protein